MADIFEALNLIDGFAELPKGWNFGEGVPATLLSLQQSRDMLRFAFDSGITEFEAFPGIDGEIQISCYKKEDDTLDVTFEINGTTTVSFEKGDKRMFYKKNIAFNQTIKILKDFAYNQCLSYVSSTSTNIIVNEKSESLEWHLDRPQSTVAFRSLTGIARSGKAPQSVTILSNSTVESPEPQLYFGKFLVNPSHHCHV